MTPRRLISAFALLGSVPILVSSAAADTSVPLVVVEMVTVGDAENLVDEGRYGDNGSIAYQYEIGKYEVTNQEYTDFLNAVDPGCLNQLALYNSNMDLGYNGGISFSLVYAPGARYKVKAGFTNKPATYLNFFNCVRFCNWLHNGAQVNGDTENGAYTLLGGEIIPTNGYTVLRNSDAKFAVPTVDEWYKAAYYQPASDGGDVDNYWTYPTKGNSEPNASLPPGISPSANFDDVLTVFTDVGSYTTTVGYYGTFDMAGNVGEWTESIFSSSRDILGSSWDSSGSSMTAGSRTVRSSPTNRFNVSGVRIISL